MKLQKSPGQKRKSLVRTICILLFLASTYLVSEFFSHANSEALRWVENHQALDAQILELNQEEEEYRNRKGKKRSRTNYYMSYSFTYEDETFESSAEITRTIFGQYDEGQSIEVWYPQDDIYNHELAVNVQRELENNTPTGNLIQAGPIAAGICLGLYWILTLLFVRESKKALPKGFYTEISWLDIDDHYLVALEEGELVYFDIHKNQASAVQSAYQQGKSPEELYALSKSENAARIPLNEISSLSSNHNSDVITIQHGDKTHSVEFLNQTVKAHALERIEKRLPQSMDYQLIQRSRLQATLPPLIIAALLAGIIFWLDMFILRVILGFVGLAYVMPKLISQLFSPTETQTWTKTEDLLAKQA
ncbi:hypothetical protein MO867_18360 [Microbulbifer sp. OS29]|uniref:DUF3592 domain-containing protein n=1 Tax=Microbulbifer okhotskensis TaxID=2926617 RepID=A0A9X2J781_9GAMM|nr:hypothetical protein [Microbulbifer okhotskensis]MCO1336299.1 hypothetical protein [Microbulbifer okhotskensis]